MGRLQGAGIKFFLLVVIPAVLTIGLTASAIFNIVGNVADQANAIAREKNIQAAKAAVAGLEERMRSLAEDNATWDEAVLRTTGEIDEDWIDRTWRASTFDGIYDSFIVKSADAKTLLGFVDGKRIDAAATGVLGPGVSVLIGQNKRDSHNPRGTAGLSKINGQVFVVGVAPIIPSKVSETVLAAEPNYFVSALELRGPLLDTLARSYALDGLAVSSEALPGLGIPLVGPDGGQVAWLSWQDSLPGDAARAAAAPQVLTSLFLLFGVVASLLGAIWNYSRRSAAKESAAVFAAYHDQLSGLPNRRKFSELLEGMTDEPFALLFIDIDRFKQVNDSYGHEMGDKLIRAVAAGFQALAHGEAMVSRLGGDEFAILLTGPDAKVRAPGLAKLIIEFMTQPFDIDSRVISVGASIGIVEERDPEWSADEILRRADTAMYKAKTSGRNQYHIYNPGLEAERIERRNLAAALRSGMNAREITLLYQPYVSSGTREIVGVEALLRWHSPAFGHVSPAVFVSVAEEFGLIDELGMLVMFAACAQARQWPGLRVSINVSPAQFSDMRFIDTVKAAIARAGISGEQIELEVTEGYLIDSPDEARAIINRLHDMGVAVSIDDFGTGYSSIGYLRKFSFDKLKIDRSLVVGIMTNPESQKIIQATVLIADALGLNVTAEGVEHEEEAMVLRAAGVDQFQGYLFYRPMTAEQVTALISAPSAGHQAPLAAAAA